MTEIIIPYKPRYPQDVIHPQLENHRFNVLVAHRRLGKTVLAINHTVKMALKNERSSPKYAYLAPMLKQAKLIAWDYLKYYTRPLPGIKVNEAELYVDFLGRRIHIFGADNPDAIRGLYLDGAVLDEYAQIKPELWGEVLLPIMSDRDGWACFLGTPKGQNQFLEIYEKAMREMAAGNPLWWAGLFRADETGVLSEEQLQIMRSSMTEMQYRQEFLCDFTASSDDTLITIDLVSIAAARVIQEHEIEGAPRIIGVDPARFGNDSFVIQRRQGLYAYPTIVLPKLDNMEAAGRLVTIMDQFQPDATFVDSGRGEGVIDRCRQLGYDVTEVNFGGSPIKEAIYANKRTEMWDSIGEWLRQGGVIPNDPQLKSDLVSPTYHYTKTNKMILEEKEAIKTRLGRSPDRADALALTFAFPVRPKDFRYGSQKITTTNTKYNPLRRGG